MELEIKRLSSPDGNENTEILNTNFSNFNVGAFYKKYDRYFDWKVSLNSERNAYNWYGLPNIGFTEPITNAIIEEQIYNYFLSASFDTYEGNDAVKSVGTGLAAVGNAVNSFFGGDDDYFEAPKKRWENNKIKRFVNININ